VTFVLLLVAVLLAGVAALGVMRPFRRPGHLALDRMTDPLEDERAGLLRALRDLDQERATGLLAESDYRSLRGETERRAVAVLRALEARDGAGQLAADLRDLRTRPTTRPSPNGAGSPARGRRRTLIATVAAAAATVAVLVPVLAGAVHDRSGGQPATGTNQADPLSFFLDRVRQHPGDVAARLDLAGAYLQEGDVQDSVAQYLSALKIDPQNPEARATLGFLLYRSGHADEGLKAVDQALAVDPSYPEALYFKGVILLDGLNQPGPAAEAFRAYLAAAPFGSRRQEVQTLLEKAERAAGT
jgi:cytochrome c-type biogenesis protein CcmH/NrfG